MSGDEDADTKYQVMFSGKKKDFARWVTKYEARAMTKKFGDILDGTKVLRRKTEIDAENNANMVEDVLIMEMNMKAYNDLLLSMDDSQRDGRKAFNIVKACKTSDYLRSNAKMAWAKLKEKYEPTNMSSVVAIKQEFNARTLKDKEDPTEWLLELGELQDRLADMNNHMTDQHFMIHVIGNLPKEYRLERKEFTRKLKGRSRRLKKSSIWRTTITLRTTAVFPMMKAWTRKIEMSR